MSEVEINLDYSELTHNLKKAVRQVEDLKKSVQKVESLDRICAKVSTLNEVLPDGLGVEVTMKVELKED